MHGAVALIGRSAQCASAAVNRIRVEFKPERRVLVVVTSGGRAALAAASLRELGSARVAHLDGSSWDWEEAGSPIAPDT